MKVYAVQFGNYDPAEVDSIWDCRACAEKRASELGGMWEVSVFDVLHTHEIKTVPEPGIIEQVNKA